MNKLTITDEQGTSEYDVENVLRRAILNMCRLQIRYPRKMGAWFYCAELFGLQSDSAKRLCRHLGIDPEGRL